MAAAAVGVCSTAAVAASCPPVETAAAGDKSAFASYWASQPVKPGQTVSVSGGGSEFGPGMSVEIARLPDCTPGLPGAAKPMTLAWVKLSAPAASSSSALFTLPSHLPQGAYAYRFSGNGKVGPRNYVNRPDIFFASGNSGTGATRGGYIQVHGTALDLFGTASPARLALVKNGAPVAYLSTDPTELVKLDGGVETVSASMWATYRVRTFDGALNNGYRKRFYVPSDVPVGSYELWFHPGYGGPEAWVRYSGIDASGAVVDTLRITEAPRDVLKSRLPWLTMSTDATRSPDDRLAAVLATAKAKGGAIVVIPVGTYEMKRPIVLPANTVLRGYGFGNLVTLHWASEMVGPGGPEDYATLVTGEVLDSKHRAAFSIVGIRLQTESNRNPCIGVDGAPAPVKIWGVTCELKDTLPEPNLLPSKTPWGYFGALPGVWIRNSTNVDIYNSTIRAPQPIYTTSSSYVTAEGNNLLWRNQHSMIEGSSSAYVFEKNKFLYDGKIGDEYNSAPGNEQALYLQSRFANQRDLYIGSNLMSSVVRQTPNGIIGSIRFDTAFGTHMGGVAAVDPETGALTLAEPISTVKTWYAARAGDMVEIVSGRGEGQIRAVKVRANSGSSIVQVDRPWDVQPDGTSVVHIRNFQGHYLYVRNDTPFDGRWSDYFTSHELTVAENRMGAVGRVLLQWEFLGKHYWGPTPALALTLRNQYLDNTFVNAGFGLYGDAPADSPYSQQVSFAKKNTIFRGNRTVRNANGTWPAFTLTVFDRAVDGQVVEDNTGLTALRIRQPAWGASANGLFRRNLMSNGTAATNPWPTVAGTAQ